MELAVKDYFRICGNIRTKFFNSFMTESVWTGFYMITASVMKGLNMFHTNIPFLCQVRFSGSIKWNIDVK